MKKQANIVGYELAKSATQKVRENMAKCDQT